MTPAIPYYSTHFTLQFYRRADGRPTSTAERTRVISEIQRDQYLDEYFDPNPVFVGEHATTAAVADWPPEGPDGYGAAFARLSEALPNVIFRVFGWGADPADAWETNYIAGEAQFASASVLTPPRLDPTGKIPECSECGHPGPHTMYFSPRVFKASVNPDLSVEHQGLVQDALEEPAAECGRCSAPILDLGVWVLEHE